MPGVGDGVGEEFVGRGDADGDGVDAALDKEALEVIRSAAIAIPTLGMMADPLGLTLSSIRRKSLYMLGRWETSRDHGSEPISCHTKRGPACR